MYIIKQKYKSNERFIVDSKENWTYDIAKAKVWTSKVLAEAYVKFRGYKKCTIEEREINEGEKYV